MKYTGPFVSFISAPGFYDRIERIKLVLRIEQRMRTQHLHILHMAIQKVCDVRCSFLTRLICCSNN